PESLRKDADDRLSLASFPRVQGADGLVKGRDFADVRPQPTDSQSLDDLGQLGAIGLDNEVDCQAVVRPRHRWADDGDQCSSISNEPRGPLADVTADDIEYEVDMADVVQRVVVVEIDEFLCAKVECFLPVSRASGANDIRTSLARELR